MKRIKSGVYEYRGYRVYCCGYHHPDHCVWWEACDAVTDAVMFHNTTKRDMKLMIDNYCDKGL